MTKEQSLGVEEPCSSSFLGELLTLPEGDDVLGCMQCGTCSGTCPLGEAMEYPPRRIITQTRADEIQDMLASPSLWMCVGCYTCSSRCPREIQLADRLWPALRDRAFREGIQPPAELQETLENLYKYGNLLGKSPRKRLDWTNGLDVPVPDLSKDPHPVDVLWLVGCYPSYYPRNQVVARAFARILNRLNVNFGVLGSKEKSPGDCERLFGEEGLFDMLVESNKELLSRYEFNRIVLLDTHGYRAMNNFYPSYGVNFPVEHYTMFLANWLDELRPMLTKPIEAKVTYHDNCCIGRRCGCYQAPRSLLEIIPGIELVEMERNRENSLCCGGGGGGMWLDSHIVEHGGRRLSDERVAEAAGTGADILAVSCPFELSRFEDSAKVVGVDGRLRVRDIIELLVESMGLDERNNS
jgi:Fe-S oxidoreductase